MNRHPAKPMNAVTGSIRDLIDGAATECPDAIFLVDPQSGMATTYSDLQAGVRKVAASIAANGILPGSAIAYAFGNSPLAATTILGIQYGGYLAAAINLVAGSDTIAYVLKHSEAKMIIGDERGRQVIEEALENELAGLPFIALDTITDSRIDRFDMLPPDERQDGLLMYTSGTTGRPKGVVLTHSNLIAGGQNTAISHQLSSVDRGMCVLPLYHINGLCVTVMGALVSGSSLVIPAKFSVGRFWETVRRHDCTWFSVVPTQISYLLHQDMDASFQPVQGLRFGRSASAPLSPEVQEAFEKRFGIPVIETMGLTETAAQILSNPLPPGIRKIGSPGIPFGNEVLVADEFQNEKPRGEEGEIIVRGANIMRCYLKNEKATTETLTKDGWLRTGDLGRMDADGYVYVTGRLKELIIKGGENIAPREIDEALYSHPDVIEAAAFSRPCEQYGERVEAAVKLGENALVTPDELREICVAKLGAFKAPDRIYILAELPKGPSGKIQRIKISRIVDEISVLVSPSPV